MIRYLRYSCLLGSAWLVLGTTGCDSSSGQKSIDAGIRALETGDTLAAVRHWEKARRQRPGSSAVYYNLGAAYWQAGDLDKAENAFIQADELSDDGLPPALEFLGHVRLQKQDIDGAHQAFEQAGRSGEATARLQTAMALTQINAQPQRQDMARVYLNAALQADPDYAPALYNLASLQRDTFKDSEQATRTFKRYIKAAGSDASHVQKAAESIQRMESPTSIDPPTTGSEPPAASAADPFLTKARSALARPDGTTEAVGYLDQAVAADPTHADALWLLAETLATIPGQDLRARNAFELFRRRFPADPRVRQIPTAHTNAPPPGPTAAQRAQQAFEQGERHRSAREWKKAEAAYGQALQAQPTHKGAALNLGYVLKSSGDPDGARRAFDRAAKLDPKNPDPLFMTALIYRESGDNSKAADTLDKVFSLDPNYAKAYLLMAYVRWDQGKQRAALSHMERFVELSPPGPAVEKAKQWIKQTQGQ